MVAIRAAANACSIPTLRVATSRLLALCASSPRSHLHPSPCAMTAEAPDAPSKAVAAVTASAPPVLPVPKPEQMLVSSPAKPLPSPSKTAFPPPPPATVVGNWILQNHVFSPRRDHFAALCSALSRRRIVDRLMWFRFHADADANSTDKKRMMPVHYSRLAWVGGPLADLVIPEHRRQKAAANAESHRQPDEPMLDADGNTVEEDRTDTDDDPDDPYTREQPVDLSVLDTPRTFAIAVKFLYCEDIHFNYLTFDELVALATTAHRWHLTDLYHATHSYVMDQNLLSGGTAIRTFIPLVAHEETPEAFRRYFCIAVGHHFDVLYPRLRAMAATNPNLVPPLWTIVIKQGMLSHVLHCIALYSDARYDTYLLDVILRHYESYSKNSPSAQAGAGDNDDDILGLLSQLSWDDIDLNAVLSSTGPAASSWSLRAIRLAALASYAPSTDALEVRIPWNIPLQQLLKTDVWSFQTEHVPCGPYICYLHVRKGAGKEVSLFVHIWNYDQKPIADDARHELVRVKCRATERNCRCDSSKQWSDASHGFLENLKFEGKLERYPGLGWSQFLEEKRLEEWRGCHGDDCGLAITTVLQFVKPRKQFEGPARRLQRAPSPGRLASPIQKKRSGSRMKLRELR